MATVPEFSFEIIGESQASNTQTVRIPSQAVEQTGRNRLNSVGPLYLQIHMAAVPNFSFEIGESQAMEYKPNLAI